MKKYFFFTTLFVAACSYTDSVAIRRQDISVDVDPWYEQTWELGASDSFQPVDNNTWWAGGTIKIIKHGNTQIGWDSTDEGIDPTGSRSLKITFDETSTCCGVQIFLPDASTKLPQVIWQEQWIKYDSNWDMVSLDNCESSIIEYNGHKTIWWYTNEQSNWRHEFLVGVKGTDLVLTHGMSTRRTGLTDTQIDEQTQVFDGQWHRWRFRLTRPQIDELGWYTVWLDDQILHDWPEEALGGDGGPPYWGMEIPHFSSIQLSNNMRCPPPSPQSIWYGRTVVYLENPNWF